MRPFHFTVVLSFTTMMSSSPAVGAPVNEGVAVAVSPTRNENDRPDTDHHELRSTKKRIRELEENLKDYKKRCKTAVDSAAEEFVCPITLELPIDPVVAEDGKIYDRQAIESHIDVHGENLKSPLTNEPMGAKLIPSVCVRNNIRALVESGIVKDDIAKPWKEKILVDEMVKKANEGDTDAMIELGEWYRFGDNGLVEDDEKAYKWYKKAADLHDPHGLYIAGMSLLYGDGVARNETRGMSLVSLAAGMGLDTATYRLGYFYRYGEYGLPEDEKWAMKLFRKVLDGSCSIKRLSAHILEEVQEELQMMEEESA